MVRGTSELLAEGTTVNMVHRKQQQRSLHQQQQTQSQQQTARKSVGVMGSRRIFAPSFKLKVLDSYRHDFDVRGNQRATARKYGIHRRQIQKWLQCEDNLRSSCAETSHSNSLVSSSSSSSSSSPASSLSSPSSTTSSSPSASLSTTVISKHDVTSSTTEGVTTMPDVTPAVAAPALNLGLARLHGDEPAARPLPPPPLPPRSLSVRDSPSSPRYAHPEIVSALPSTTATTSTTTITIVPPGYTSGGNTNALREQQQQQQENGTVRQVSTTAFYDWINVLDQQRSRDHENSHYDGENETKIYETLTTCFRSPRRDLPYPPMDVATLTNGNLVNADSSIDGNAYGSGRALTPSMIKTERASPDSAATCTRLPLSPRQLSRGSGGGAVGDRCRGGTAASTVLFPTRESLRSEKCIESADGRRVSSGIVHEDEKDKAERQNRRLFCGVTVKKEEEEEEEEVEKEEVASRLDEEKEEVASRLDEEKEIRDDDASACVDSHLSRRSHFRTDSRNPEDDQEGSYSEPGSSSARSSSGSCSDSEMDSLVECCPSNEARTSSNDLGRRRSFSLRFKLDVLDAFHRDVRVAGNQRATARKYGINRRQVQKWLGQESELRGEIALRGNARQRLGPSQDQAPISTDSPVDLRTTNYLASPCTEEERVDVEYVERSPPSSQPPQTQQFYCCELAASPSLLPYYNNRLADLSPEPALESSRICGYPCCADASTTTSNSSCYQELRSSRGSSYADSINGPSSYCYLSPREYTGEASPTTEDSSTKRRRCTATLPCCYDEYSLSPKRLRVEADETPPQETPLCLVKPKRFRDVSPSRVEPVTSTVPTPPAPLPPSRTQPSPQAPPPVSNTKDAILFKPYLDNPISKPSKENSAYRDLSPLAAQNLLTHDNNNCQSICNLNEDRNGGHDYALKLNLRVPLSWRNQTSGNTPYNDFQPIRSAFVRYPASPHYI